MHQNAFPPALAPWSNQITQELLSYGTRPSGAMPVFCACSLHVTVVAAGKKKLLSKDQYLGRKLCRSVAMYGNKDVCTKLESIAHACSARSPLEQGGCFDSEIIVCISFLRTATLCEIELYASPTRISELRTLASPTHHHRQLRNDTDELMKTWKENVRSNNDEMRTKSGLTYARGKSSARADRPFRSRTSPRGHSGRHAQP